MFSLYHGIYIKYFIKIKSNIAKKAFACHHKPFLGFEHFLHIFISGIQIYNELANPRIIGDKPSQLSLANQSKLN